MTYDLAPKSQPLKSTMKIYDPRPASS